MGDFKFYSDDVDPNDAGGDDAANFSTFGGRDSVIIAVDCCEEMFNASLDEENVSPFAKVCEAVKDMQRNRIICSEKDLQGLIFLGTKETKNHSDFKHIYTVQDLDSPSAARIEELQTLENSTDDEILAKYGRSRDHQISELLWCCSSEFSRSPLTLSSKTLVIFTWNDNPHQGDRNAHLLARTKAKDLMEQDITIQVLSFNKDFNYEKFYKDVISDPEIDDTVTKNPIDQIINLYDFLLRKCTKQRTMARIPFQLFDGMEMAVGVYTVAVRAKKGSNVNIDATTNQEVQMRTNFVDKDTGDILLPGDINFLQKWGGRDIVFEDEEVQDVRRFADTGLKLLGFKPRGKAINAWQHVKPAQFLYPNEKAVKGSTTLFSALLTKCLDRDVVPICTLAARSNSAPRCVALLPQPEETDEATGEQTQSPGFYVIFLPFSEDLRNVETQETPSPSHEQVSAAEAMIKKLRFTYRTSNFDNPALQSHYRNLEAMALEKDEPEATIDHTLPDNARIDRKAGDFITSFKELVFPEGYNPNKTKARPVKRKQDGGGDGAGQRKRPDVASIDVKEMAVNGQLSKLTVPVLKEFCKNNGIACAGKKRDLIKAIENRFL